MSIHWGMWFVHTWSWNATIRRNYEHIPGGSVVKNLPTMQETWVRSLGQEGLLEKEMVTHSSVLAGEIPQMEEPGRLQSTELQRVGHNLATKHTHECIMLSKKKRKSQAKKLHNARKFIYEMSRKGKSRETESRLMVSRGLGHARVSRDGYWTGVWEGAKTLLALEQV